MTYSGLYEFTEHGLAVFEKVFRGEFDEEAVAWDDEQIVNPIAGTRAFGPVDYRNAHEMAQDILRALGSNDLSTMLPRTGLWAWLSFVLRDQLYPRDAKNRRKIGEVHRWYPSDPGDYMKAQRHLVRMPVVLLERLGPAAEHLLCLEPRILPDIREQLTSQQDMLHHAFQEAALKLYYNPDTESLKRGYGSKGAGSPRRLAEIRAQFDVTWHLFDLDADEILRKLPKEFDKFRDAKVLGVPAEVI